MTVTAVDLRGAELNVTTPLGQALEILFNFPIDISAWTWLGQVRLESGGGAALATFSFSHPSTTQLIAVITEADIATLGTGSQHYYEIEQVTPLHRQMFYGRLLIKQDYAR